MAKITIAIFETDQEEKILRKLIKEADNTFAPFGSGGYYVKENEEGFLVEELDCSPPRKYKVGICGGEIWVFNEFRDFIADLLIRAEVHFVTDFRSFKNKEQIRQAFNSMKSKAKSRK